MKCLLPMLILMILMSPAISSPPEEKTYHPEELLLAIRFVESSFNDNSIGDGGKAIGPFQIWRVYWIDSGMHGKYQQCFEYTYAKEIVRRYVYRYTCIDLGSRKSLTIEECRHIARLHNGGPGGPFNPKTLGYWNKVKRELEKRRLP
jgi:hypothetical protein